MEYIEKLNEDLKALKNGRTYKQLKIENIKTYYKAIQLRDTITGEKALLAGKYIKKEHLTEYKPLIIWLMRNKTNYRGHLNLKEAMCDMLKDVESKKIVYIYPSRLKKIICDMAIRSGLWSSENNLRKALYLSATVNYSEHRELSKFEEFKLDVLTAND